MLYYSCNAAQKFCLEYHPFIFTEKYDQLFQVTGETRTTQTVR